MNIQHWYRSMLLCHMTAFCVESLFFAACLASIAYGIVLFEPQSTQLILSLTILIWVAASILRFYKSWDNRALWTILEKKYPGLKGHSFVIENFLLGEGHFPDEKMKDMAIQQMNHAVSDIHYPWSEVFTQKKPEYLGALCLMIIPALIQLYDFSAAKSSPVKISIQPPAYLKLKAQDIYNLDHPIGVYPGTLMKCSVTESDQTIILKDSQGSLYLPSSQDETGSTFEIRILKQTNFEMSKDGKAWKDWKVTLLEDKKPNVEWKDGPNTEPSDWEEIDLAYSAQDDIALGDSFITVNGDELEYAGSPSGRKTYSYNWTFDPFEHIDLSGGNVELQITSYDQDRVLGPKYAQTKAIIWKYLGVLEQTKRTLQALENVEEKSRQRRSQLQKQAQGADDKVAKAFENLLDEMKKNPVISKSLQGLAQDMLNDEQEIQDELTKHGANPQSQKEELNNIKRNELYADHIRQSLKALLSTVKTAELIKELNEASDKLASGEKVDEQTMEDLYQKLEDTLKENGASPQERDAALNKMEQAQLSQKLNQGKEAAQSLQQLAEALRQQQSQGQQQQSELSKKFQEKVDMLRELIAEQNNNTRKYFEVLHGKGHRSELDKKTSEVIDKINASEPVKKYKDIYPKLISGQKSLSEEELKELSKENSIFRQGNLLADLSRRLNLVRQGRVLARSAQLMSPGQLNQLNVDSSLKKDYMKIYHSLIGQTVANQKSGTRKVLEPVTKEQENISTKGKGFAQSFREDFSIFFNSSLHFDLADQGAIFAHDSLRLLRIPHESAPQSMSKAHNNWQRLLDLLEQMQQQAREQQQNQQLQIGKDGKLSFQRQPKIIQEGEDGQEHQHRDVELELPEEFQNAKLIEKRLKNELKAIKDEKEREQFRAYMLDLLE